MRLAPFGEVPLKDSNWFVDFLLPWKLYTHLRMGFFLHFSEQLNFWAAAEKFLLAKSQDFESMLKCIYLICTKTVQELVVWLTNP